MEALLERQRTFEGARAAVARRRERELAQTMRAESGSSDRDPRPELSAYSVTQAPRRREERARKPSPARALVSLSLSKKTHFAQSLLVVTRATFSREIDTVAKIVASMEALGNRARRRSRSHFFRVQRTGRPQAPSSCLTTHKNMYAELARHDFMGILLLRTARHTYDIFVHAHLGIHQTKIRYLCFS